MFYIIQMSLHHLNIPKNIMLVHFVNNIMILGHVEQKTVSIPTCLSIRIWDKRFNVLLPAPHTVFFMCSCCILK